MAHPSPDEPSPDEQQSEPARASVAADWKEKYLNGPFLITALLAIGGIAWGVYSHYQTLRLTSLNFGVLGRPTLIYDHSAASKGFRDLAKGVWFDEDVFTWRFWVWNNGDRRITPDMVREKVTVILPGVTNVYEYGIERQTNRRFDNIRIDSLALSSNDSLAVAYLGWDYLDPGSAAVFYITATGTTYQPQISGDILGADAIEMELLSSFDLVKPLTSFDVAFLVFLALCLLFGLFAASRKVGRYLATATASRYTVTSQAKVRLLRLFFTYLLIPFGLGLVIVGFVEAVVKILSWLWLPDIPPILEEMIPRSYEPYR